MSLLNRCSAYGNDLPDLTLSVEYETTSRLHVHIYDSPLHQYQISDSFLPRPNRTLTGSDSVKQSDLEFEYNSSPFEFWITRKSDGQVLFDTRAKNIPVHDDQVLIEGVASNYTYLPGYPLVVEDQYLQIASNLPVGANIFGLGEVIVGSLSPWIGRRQLILCRREVGTGGTRAGRSRLSGRETLEIQ